MPSHQMMNEQIGKSLQWTTLFSLKEAEELMQYTYEPQRHFAKWKKPDPKCQKAIIIWFCLYEKYKLANL